MLAPATDPDVVYPPGYTSVGQVALEGFSFTMLAGAWSGSRLTFNIQSKELWSGWCGLQKTVYDGYCLPNWEEVSCGGCCLKSPDGGTLPVDCGKLNSGLCDWGSPCACSETPCSVNLDPAKADLTFDLNGDGNHLDGSLVFGKTIGVHLTRAP
jgi:hypothetical protein